MEMMRRDSGWVGELKAKYIKQWWDTSVEFPRFDKNYSSGQQASKEKEMDACIDRMLAELKLFQTDNCSDTSLWSSNVRNLIRHAGNDIIELTGGSMDILLDGGFCNVTSDFIGKAREFDPSIKMEDIMQAMRNVWIMNSIQMLMGRDVKYAPSLFAYSMLYPFTDNYLDAPDIPLNKKKEISKRFRRRLGGESVKQQNSYEASLFKLVGMIEEQYPRASNHQVYECLLGIHDAQQKSLLQQTGKTSPYETDIMGISFEKGGMSVLTDACLVNGSLTEAEAAFMFAFGILLQLADDLQDVQTDMKNRHMTLFSQTAGKWPLDNITNRLFNFTYDILDHDDQFTDPGLMKMKSIIKNSCTFLLLGAIANNRTMFTKSYIKDMEKNSTFRFQYMQKLYRKAEREYANMRKNNTGKPVDTVIAQALAQN